MLAWNEGGSRNFHMPVSFSNEANSEVQEIADFFCKLEVTNVS